MAGYSDAMDTDAQITMEEWAATLTFDRVRGREKNDRRTRCLSREAHRL